LTSSAKRSVASGVVGAGFTTSVLPASSADGSLKLSSARSGGEEATQAFGDVFDCCIERGVGIRCFTFAAQPEAAPDLDGNIAGEEAARPAEGDLRLEGLTDSVQRNASDEPVGRVLEILAFDGVEVICHTRAQRVRKFEQLARHRDLHPELYTTCLAVLRGHSM